MTSLNLGILAHVDAGKTSLTERLLFSAGVIDEIGSVDAGNTHTDTLPLEQERGITIRSAVVSFTIGDLSVNLIDTPGHPDFIAEVERVLRVLDGAVLVVSAVEGVQAQTRVLMRALQRLGIPTLIFVNKIDRAGAAPGAVVRRISESLTPAVVAMGSARTAGSRRAAFQPHDRDDPAFTTRLVDVLSGHDDSLVADFVDDPRAVTHARLQSALAAQAKAALVHPVFVGSAATGAGVEDLAAGITEFLPVMDGAADGPVAGTVFKVERGSAGEKVAYVRMTSGSIGVRDRITISGRAEAKVTAIHVFERGAVVQRPSVGAGQIAKVWGLTPVQIGDDLGAESHSSAVGPQFSPPSLETVVDPCRPADGSALHAGLTQLAEQDPLINVRQDDVRREISVSLYGEVQKEVIQATLAREYGVDVTFRQSSTICVERPTGSGAAVEVIGTESNPFLATVGLRVDPAAAGSGVAFGLEVELGSMPPAFFTAVEESAREALLQGIHGWEVPDCSVTMTHSGYWARQSHSHGTFDASMSSTAGDFRNLTPLVLMAALQRAGTGVYEPIHRVDLEIPADTLGPTLRCLAPLHGVPVSTEVEDGRCLLVADLPAARVHDLRRALPTLTHGEGVLSSAFARHQLVKGPVPERARTDRNPLDRREYLLRVT